MSPSSESNLRKPSSIKSALEESRNRRQLNSFWKQRNVFRSTVQVQANIIRHTNILACATNEPGVRLCREKKQHKKKKEKVNSAWSNPKKALRSKRKRYIHTYIYFV